MRFRSRTLFPLRQQSYELFTSIMAEYWKSTPKYWCKFCTTYVRETKFERQQHEATPRHRGAIQRSLRSLHRGNEREERDRQRAKAEVNRLNGIVGETGASAISPGGTGNVRSVAVPSKPVEKPRQATAEDRKKQLAQLAEMGVAIPQEFRREMAMAGEWQTVSEKQIVPNVKKEPGETKPNVQSIGARKRKQGGPVCDDEEEERPAKTWWGNRVKTYPGAEQSEDDVLRLLEGKAFGQRGRDTHTASENGPSRPEKSAPTGVELLEQTASPNGAGLDSADGVKAEEQESSLEHVPRTEPVGSVPGAGITFKKRKNKAARVV